MTEKRFEFKLKVNFIDEETGEEIYHKVLIDNSNGNEIGFDDMVGLLNEQQATIEELRLQEKEKGVPVFVVRDGKNPVALFFNEQRAMYYCQENVAHLTYQQEKWCRVE